MLTAFKKPFSILKILSETPGPVGNEEKVQKVLMNAFSTLNYTSKHDSIGNYFFMKEFQHKNNPRIAIVAHSDEIGFLVRDILPDGFIKLAFNTAAVFPDARFLPGSSIKFITKNNNNNGEVIGVFGLRSGHIAGREGKKTPLIFKDMFVDLGCSNREEVENLGIDIGTPAVFSTTLQSLNNTTKVFGKAMDDRVGLTIELLLADKLAKHDLDITFISTVQEEIGMRGAAAAAKTNFDYVINLDVGLSGDIPGTEKDHIITRIGKGPIIIVKDFSIHYDNFLIGIFEKTAKEYSFPYQKGIYDNYNTDGLHFFSNGMKTVTIGVPCRYTHTNFETIDLVDLQTTVDLIEKVIFQLTERQ